MATADPRCAMLASMTECAYRLGMAFGAEAERAPDLDTKLKWFPLFDRCFFAVRVSTALELRLKHTPAEPREAASDREALHDRADPPEREDREPGYTERDRDREVERASFPILIRALEGIAADAQALPGPEPAELPTLRELLAKVKSQPAPVAAAPRRAPSLRATLAGSGAATVPAPERRPASNVAEILAARRATGPPRR